jgi:hypothetical protein
MKSDCIFESYPVPVTDMLLDRAAEISRGFPLSGQPNVRAGH